MKDEGKVLEEILGPVNNENIKLRPHCSIGALVAYFIYTIAFSE
jgi:hypothetical protein